MATNRVQRGEIITFTNTGAAISSGDVVIIGNLVGVALTDIAATTGVGEVAISEVYDLPKVDAAVIAVGERVTFDISAAAVEDAAFAAAAGDITTFGVAFEALGATTGALIQVLLTPGVGVVT